MAEQSVIDITERETRTHLYLLLHLPLGGLGVNGREVCHDLVYALAARSAHKSRQLPDQGVRYGLGLSMRP